MAAHPSIARTLLALVLAVAAAPGAAADAGAGAGAGFADPIVTPARMTDRALRAPVFALARGGGDVMLGVGPRGHILRSQDAGRTWAQVPCPVSTDLVAVAFAGPAVAWAVGHDGVMLHSTDAGATWRKRFDGFALAKLLVDHYTTLAATQPTAAVQRALDEAHKTEAGGAALSLLSVWFRNEREGFAAGQFNLLLHTADGGASWQPWLERTDNPDSYSLHAIAGDAQQVWIAGELGLVLRLAGSGNEAHFERLASPYKGSWFGLAVERSSLLLFGLRGNAWRSDDGGANWLQLATGTDQAINAGTIGTNGGVALLTGRGRLLAAATRGATPTPLPREGRVPAAAYALLAASPQRLVLGTSQGVQALELPAAPTKP